MVKRVSVIFLILLIKSLCVYSQGLSFIKEYDQKTYSNHRQNWAITEDSSGYIYFGNQAGGLIQFDGINWKSHHLKRGSAVRSLIQFSNKIYWGGSEDFGIVEKDSLNNFFPKSLGVKTDSLHQNFSDVWEIVKYDNDLYFRTYEGIFILNDKMIDLIDSDQRFLGLFNVDEQLLVKIKNEGLYFIDNSEFIEIEGSGEFINDPLFVVLPLAGNHLFISRQQGFQIFDGKYFHPFHTEAADHVMEHRIYRGTYFNENQIALATLSGGIVIMNTDGSLETILTEEDGLPTDIIYELYTDREGTLWAATDNGIAKILVNNPVTRLDERSGFGGISTFIETVGDTTYIGSTEGLFYSVTPGRVEKIPGITNPVYDGVKTGDEIIISTPDGIFRVSGEETTTLSSTSFPVLQTSAADPELLYGSDHEVIYEITIDGDEAILNEIVSVPGEVRHLYDNNNELWIVTSDSGVLQYMNHTLSTAYEVSMEEGKQYQRLDFLGGRLRLGTDGGLFVYEAEVDSFVEDTTFGHAEMNTSQVNLFRQCGDNEIWFRNNRKVKRALFEDGEWTVAEDPYRLIDDGESIAVILCGNDGSAWFGGTAGIYHLSDPDWKYDHEFNTNITGVLIHNDSLVYGGYGEPETPFVFDYEDNELRFTYAAASYIAPEQNTYRVRLRGYDEDWSSWTSETEKDYTFIPEGTYTFEVQGRNVYRAAGTIDSFTFTTLPPWYRTAWAYIGYMLLIGGVFYGLHKLRLNNILREQRIRNRIASDLHDEVSATLSSITYFAQAIRQLHDGKKSGRFVELISESASEAKEKITDIIWSIDPDNDDWVNLLSKCRRFASDLFESKGIEYELEIATDIQQPLDLELRQHLWLIFKEMVVNAARHSGAGKVEIYFGPNSPELVLKVQDNGCGIDEEKSKAGHGIKNIRKRAAAINADISLETDPEIGTRWILRRRL